MVTKETIPFIIHPTWCTCGCWFPMAEKARKHQAGATTKGASC